MADKQYGWLDAETAERLLRGESLDNAVDAAARDEAERLAKTLGALTVDPPPPSAELPGEAAALAAFRTARTARSAPVRTEQPAHPTGRTATAHPASGDTAASHPAPGPTSAFTPAPGHAAASGDTAVSHPASDPTGAFAPASGRAAGSGPASGDTAASRPAGGPTGAGDPDQRDAAASAPGRDRAFGRRRSGRRGVVSVVGQLAPADAEADLVRIGAPAHHAAPRPRRGSPLRVGLVAALALGMAGGVAAAVGSGILPTPFGDDEPRPGASVSAAVSPDRPLVSPSPDGAGEGEPTPDGSTSGPADPGASRQDAGGAPSTDPGSDQGSRQGGSGAWWNGAPSACRDLRDGKQLTTDRRHALEGLAGGSSQVWKYCKGVLDTAEGQPRQSDGQSGQYEERRDSDDNGGGDDDSHHGTPGDNGNGNGDGNGRGSGNGHRRQGGFGALDPTPSPASPSSSASSDGDTPLPRRAAATPDPSPNPTYTTL